MDIRSIKLVFFSPTGTTAKIVNRIAQGINPDMVTGINLTPPGARSQDVGQINDELTIIGTPVYAGRVPPEALSRLRRIKGNNTPAVVVVVYGNRDYEDALLELRDVVVDLGFRPIAGGAFIGEHSYSNAKIPIAAGRPDDQDMETAKRFGELIRGKMRKISTLDGMPALDVPGNFPYKNWIQRPEMAPVTVESLCTLCAECAAACPTAAITVADSVVTTSQECIHCSACIKKCPAGARKWESAWIDQISKWLKENCQQRKEPQTYW
jgi:ferredoxin